MANNPILPTVTLILHPLSTIEPESVRWLWPGYLPAGKLSILEGDPGTGKSLVSLDIAARVSNGGPMPDGASCEGGHVILMNAEDGLADTVVQRLIAAGANRERITALTAVVEPNGERLLDIGKDIPQLEVAINQSGAKLIVLDPLNSYFPAKVNTWNDHHIRQVLSPLAAMAERTGVAILVIRHLNKMLGNNPIYRGGGSIGIIAAARAGFLVAALPKNPNVKVFAAVKFNLGPLPPSLSFELLQSENGTSHVEWMGTVGFTAADLTQAQAAPPKTGQQDAAAEFLVDLLQDGPKPAAEVDEAAKAHGISHTTLMRAKKDLGVKPTKVGFGAAGQWVWSLGTPADIQADPSAPNSAADDGESSS